MASDVDTTLLPKPLPKPPKKESMWGLPWEDAEWPWTAPRYERVVLFDSVTETIFTASLPMSELIKNLPESARWVTDIGPTRWKGAGLFSLVGALLMYGLFFPLFGQILALFPGLMFGLPIGATVGWFLGPMLLGDKPFWTLRRLYVETPDGAPDPEIALIPIEHTFNRGLPSALWSAHRQGVEQERIRVAREQAEHQGGSDLQPVGGPSYTPTVWRATTLYDVRKCQDVRDDLRGPMGRGQKVVIGSLILMALCSAGLLVFVMFATTNG